MQQGFNFYLTIDQDVTQQYEQRVFPWDRAQHS